MSYLIVLQPEFYVVQTKHLDYIVFSGRAFKTITYSPQIQYYEVCNNTYVCSTYYVHSSLSMRVSGNVLKGKLKCYLKRPISHPSLTPFNENSPARSMN